MMVYFKYGELHKKLKDVSEYWGFLGTRCSYIFDFGIGKMDDTQYLSADSHQLISIPSIKGQLLYIHSINTVINTFMNKNYDGERIKLNYSSKDMLTCK